MEAEKRAQRTEHRNQTTAENAYKVRDGNRIKAEGQDIQ